jgi:hypothetical protein
MSSSEVLSDDPIFAHGQYCVDTIDIRIERRVDIDV